MSVGPFFVDESREYSYDEYEASVAREAKVLGERAPSAIAVESTPCFETYVKIAAILDRGHAILLLPPHQFRDEAYRRFLTEELATDFSFSPHGQSLDRLERKPEPRLHEILVTALSTGRSHFIVRTSGSSGKKHKFVLHRTEAFHRKFRAIGRRFERTLAFFPTESIAGAETLIETLTHRTTLVAAGERLTPAGVLDKVVRNRVDYFHTSPTFLNLAAMTKQTSALAGVHDLVFGSESPQRLVIEALQRDLPHVRFTDSYGMSEIGVLRCLPSAPDATLVTLDDSINPGRVRDGWLEVKTPTPMIAYLNAPTPASPDGWYPTGDAASIENGGLRIKGRADDTINVAGRKFFPLELEDLILRLDDVADVTVTKRKNEMIGDAVVAEVVLRGGVAEADFRLRFKSFCEERLPAYMTPQRLIVLPPTETTSFKKRRNG